MMMVRAELNRRFTVITNYDIIGGIHLISTYRIDSETHFWLQWKLLEMTLIGEKTIKYNNCRGV